MDWNIPRHEIKYSWQIIESFDLWTEPWASSRNTSHSMENSLLGLTDGICIIINNFVHILSIEACTRDGKLLKAVQNKKKANWRCVYVTLHVNVVNDLIIQLHTNILSRSVEASLRGFVVSWCPKKQTQDQNPLWHRYPLYVWLETLHTAESTCWKCSHMGTIGNMSTPVIWKQAARHLFCRSGNKLQSLT